MKLVDGLYPAFDDLDPGKTATEEYVPLGCFKDTQPAAAATYRNTLIRHNLVQ